MRFEEISTSRGADKINRFSVRKSLPSRLLYLVKVNIVANHFLRRYLESGKLEKLHKKMNVGEIIEERLIVRGP